jgi:lantibiotic transport system ATP-binding protein
VPSNLAVETRNLTHRYRGGEAAVRALALQVQEGAIYGFLGPNGAGKTTTLRLVLGLLRLQEGAVAVLGRSIPRERLAVLRRVGSSVESPSLYGDLTAAENLEVWRLLFDVPRSRIPEVLRLVGLADTGSKRARAFSLGMKQRLALAVALLHEPELLVLDEPANGLDPQGILEMRDLLLQLNRERGITILVSSHVLSEVARLVSHVSVIRQGELRFQGTLSSLLERRRRETVLRTSDDGRAARLIPSARRENGKIVTPHRSDAETAGMVRTLVAAGIDVHEVTPLAADLERLFLDLVEDRR